MNASEVAAARAELGYTPGQLGARLGAKTRNVEYWESGHLEIPAWEARVLTWMVTMKRRDEALAGSGLAVCPWVTAWSAKQATGDKEDPTKLLDHARACPACRARQKWADEQLGPAPPMPRRGFLAAIFPLVRVGMWLPAWTRPAFFGAVMLIAIVAVRMVFAIPAFIIAGRLPTGSVLLAFPVAAAGGAVGGFGYSFVGKPLKTIPVVGPYLTGITTVAAYCAGLIWVAQYAVGEPLIKDPSDWYIWGIIAVVFGCVFGHALRRGRS